LDCKLSKSVYGGRAEIPLSGDGEVLMKGMILVFCHFAEL
jgi:hypothetical protein